MTKLTVFIDEGGDSGANDGIRFYNGRHEWFTLAAVAVRTENEPLTIDWVTQLRKVANAQQGRALHYQKVTVARREPLCAHMATLPLRAFVVASHKSNLREYQNPRLGRMKPAILYNFCTRLLFERVMFWADGLIKKERAQREPIEFVFSKLGGHNYDSMFGYLETCSVQRQSGKSKLPFKAWIPEMLSRKALFVEEATEGRAGLQLADVVASAFYQAANTGSPNFSVEPALALRPILPAHRGIEADLSVTVWPLKHQADFPEQSRPIFENYGYKFR